jgi:hypothetical protein
MAAWVAWHHGLHGSLAARHGMKWECRTWHGLAVGIVEEGLAVGLSDVDELGDGVLAVKVAAVDIGPNAC